MRANAALAGKAIAQADYVLLFLRLVSMVLLAFSAGYWAMLTGISDSEIRFDTMSSAWKIAATSLVVLQPIAALGLWGGWRWGVVLWILVAAIEATMYGVYPGTFGEYAFALAFHSSTILIYFLAILIISLRKKKFESDL